MNALRYHAEEDHYIDLNTMAIVFGSVVLENNGRQEQLDLDPVDIFYPEEPGFDITEPQHNCEAISLGPVTSGTTMKG